MTVLFILLKVAVEEDFEKKKKNLIEQKALYSPVLVVGEIPFCKEFFEILNYV